MLKELGYGMNKAYHGMGKAYQDMSTGEKIVYGLALFAMVGVVADNVSNEGTYTKATKGKLEKVFKSNVKKTPAGVVSGGALTGLDAINASAAPTPAVTPVNGSVKKKQNNTLSAYNQSVSAGDASVTSVNGDIKEKSNFYDEVTVNGTLYKIQINIVGDDPFVHNVTNMLYKIKEYTPKRYTGVIIHAPKTIRISPDNFNWYGGAPEDDFIQLSRGSEISGGSDDEDKVKRVLPGFYAELRNAKRSKTGVTFNNTYESELDANIGIAEYKVELGLWTEERAKEYLKTISGNLNSQLKIRFQRVAPQIVTIPSPHQGSAGFYPPIRRLKSKPLPSPSLLDGRWCLRQS